MLVPRSSAQSWGPAFTGRYDDDEIRCLVPFIGRDSFVLDVGACFGFYTVPLAKAASRIGARVLAFEPVAANLAVLESNIAANGVSGWVDVFPVGLANQTGVGLARVEPQGLGNAAIVAGAVDMTGSEPATVHLASLDELQVPMSCVGRRCTLVKMDVEGFEIAVLEGGRHFVQDHRPVIFGEFNEWFLEKYGLPLEAPLRWAGQNDYRCFQVLRRRRHLTSDRHFIGVAEGARLPRHSLLLVPSERRLPSVPCMGHT